MFDTHYAISLLCEHTQEKHRIGSGDADNVGMDQYCCVSRTCIIIHYNDEHCLRCTRTPPAHFFTCTGSCDTPVKKVSMRMHTYTRMNRESWRIGACRGPRAPFTTSACVVNDASNDRYERY